MNPVDIKECLDSMIILVDSREHPSKQAQKRYESFSSPYRRQKLDYGDYSCSFTLDGHEVRIPVAIERKASLEELSGNLIQEKERFEREFKRAMDAGARMYLLIEEGNMEKIYNGRYRTKVHPNAYKSSLWAIISRYKLSGPIFCKAETSGKVIHDILYRELKEMLERGDFG